MNDDAILDTMTMRYWLMQSQRERAWRGVLTTAVCADIRRRNWRAGKPAKPLKPHKIYVWEDRHLMARLKRGLI